MSPRLIACAVFAAILTTIAAADHSVESPPTISGVSLRGLQIGRETTVTFSGTSLASNPRLYAPFRFDQTVRKAADGSVTFVIQVESDTDANIYPIRVVTDSGISNPILLSVDELPEQTISNHADSLPVALTGELSGQTIHRVEVDLKAHQTISVDVQGQRLGSKIRPVLRAYDPTGRQVRWGKPTRLLHSDAHVRFTAEQTGRYGIELHDQLYKGPTPGFFRMKIADCPPPRFSYPVGFRDPKVSIGHWVGASNSASDLPLTFRSTFDEMTEESFADGSVADQFGVTGQIKEKGELDSYEFAVVPQSTIRCTVWSHRLGSPLDCRLRIVEAGSGKQLAQGDDHERTLDPRVDVKVPAGVEKLRAEISSQTGTHGDHSIYRLEVGPAIPQVARVRCGLNQITIPAGQHVIVPFEIQRNGAKEPVVVSPAGDSMLHFSECIATGTATRSLMEIAAPTHTQVVLPLRFVATSGEASEYVTHQTVNPNVSFPPNIDLVANVVGDSPIGVAWQSEPFPQSYPGGRFPGRISIRKPEGYEVSLNLITSQPEINEKERDAKQIRLEGMKATSDGYAFEVFVPGGFRVDGEHQWTHAVRADLKSKDGKKTIASAFTRLRKSTAKKPLELAMDSPADSELTMGEQARLSITGTISRLPEIRHAVIVRLLGIPDDSGIKVDSVQVDAESRQFSLMVDALAATKALKLDNLQLQASFDSDDPAVRDVRSNSVALKINLKSAP